MQNKQLINSDIELLNALRIVSEAYEEISVIRMRKVKENVLSTREFLTKLSEVYANVKSYEKYGDYNRKKRELKPSGMKLKSVSVLLSPNSKLYGEIVFKTYRYFVENVRNTSDDIVIVGKVGKEFFEDDPNKRPYTYFEVPDREPTIDDLKPLIYHLTHYEQVKAFHGKFESLLAQNPIVSNLSGQVESQEINEESVFNFIFEPSFEKVLSYFETQIFGSLLKQSMNEAQLGRYASRISAMEKSLENIDTKKTELYSDLRKLTRQLENRKQLSVLSGVSMWKTG